MTDANGTATYVYCLLKLSARRSPPPLARGPRGLAGTGPVRALDLDDGLRLIVADAPLRRYGSEPIEQHLRDLGWVSSCAVAHERVIEHFARHGTVIPMKLFTLFAGDERAVDHVRRSLKRVRRVLTRVSDREEWGVRLRLDERRALRQRVATAAKAPAAAGGTAFLLRKQRERQAVQNVAKDARIEADRLFTALAHRADDARRQTPAQAGTGVTVALDAAFLVPTKRAAAFRAAVKSAAATLEPRGFDVTLTGPWPPYNFVGDPT